MLTSDLDVLIAALLVLLRPAQQYSDQAELSASLHISSTQLESLSRAWQNLREYGVEPLHLVVETGEDSITKLPTEASSVDFTFYRKETGTTQVSQGESSAAADSSSPQIQKPSPSSLRYNLRLGPLAESSRSATEIFQDAVSSHQVPESEKFELLCRIRNARALVRGRRDEREKLLIIRCLAIAVYVHTHSEAEAQSAIFLLNPDLVNRLADLLQSDRGVPVEVQTAAILALDALLKCRSKIQESMAAVNANVGHGILMTLLRKTITDVSKPESSLPNLFVDTLMAYIAVIANLSIGGQALVAAGLLPFLIQIAGITFPHRSSMVNKAVQLLDAILFAYATPFQVFCNARGVEVVIDRIKVCCSASFLLVVSKTMFAV